MPEVVKHSYGKERLTEIHSKVEKPIAKLSLTNALPKN
jgi:hypothetical protein